MNIVQTQIPNVEHTQKPQASDKRKKGIFPRLPLKKALALPKAIYAIGQGEQVRRLKVFDRLGKKPESGPSRALVTVSSIYGLTDGGYQAEYLKLTEIGKKLAENENIALVFEVLFRNEIFSKFIEYWKDKSVPMDDIAKDWLQRNWSLTNDDAKSFWNVIKENIFDYHLTEQLSGRQVIVSREEALQSNGSTVIQNEASPLAQQPIHQNTFQPVTPILSSDEKKTSIGVLTAEIPMQNGGYIRIIRALEGEPTKLDAKMAKAQIDIYTNFIDQEN